MQKPKKRRNRKTITPCFVSAEFPFFPFFERTDKLEIVDLSRLPALDKLALQLNDAPLRFFSGFNYSAGEVEDESFGKGLPKLRCGFESCAVAW